MKIRTITNIEISSICDNECPYCPAPLQRNYRKVGFMCMDKFEEAISWVVHFARRGTQREVNFFGIGEPTLHPSLLSFMEYAVSKIPPGIRLHMNTNGNKMTKELAKNLYSIGIQEIDITAHHAYSAAKTIRLFREVGIRHKVSFDPILSPNNWAGQVDWFEPEYGKPYPCPWILGGQVMVMSNGDVTTCCMDAFGQGIVGNTSMEVDELETVPFKLCKTCHHTL